MRRIPLTVLILLGAHAFSTGLGLAADDLSTGNETWNVDGAGTLSTNDWPIETAFKLSIETVVDTPDQSKKPEDQAPAPPPSPRPDLVFDSDRMVRMIGVPTMKGKATEGITFMAERSLRMDAERRAVRVLDVITNSTNRAQKLSINFTQRWKSAITPKLAKPREFHLNGSKSSSGILVAASVDTQLPVLMFITGGQGKGWERSVNASAQELTWAYQGTLRANQRIVFLHWLALVDDAQRLTLRKARAALVQKGMPVDDSLNEQVLKELVNYPMEIEKETEDASEDSGDAAHRFHFVKALCDSLKLERLTDHDQMGLSGGPVLKGQFSVTGLRLKTGEQDDLLPFEKVAAIQGGAGMGRNSRVYFRDGTVTSGTVSWKEAAFKDTLLGNVRLTPESLDTLILRATDQDKRSTNFAALWVAQDGDVKGLASLPTDAANLRWVAGDLPVPWSDVVSLRQLPPPDFAHEMRLKDGSKIQGWLSPAPMAACLAYAATWADLTNVLADQPQLQKAPAPSLSTVEGSIISGTWNQDSLMIATTTAELKVPVNEIRSLTVKHDRDDTDVVLEIIIASGPTLKGRPVLGTLSWKWNGKPLTLPWAQIAKIDIGKTAPAPAPATTTGSAKADPEPSPASAPSETEVSIPDPFKP